MSKKLMNIPCHVLPIEDGNLLLPSSLVIDEMNLDVVDDWSEILWRNRKIKLLRFSEISHGTMPDQSRPYRAVILKSVDQVKDLPFYALALEGLSHTVVVNQENLKEVGSGDNEYMISTARIGSLSCLLPDLPRIEMRILQAFASTKEPALSH